MTEIPEHLMKRARHRVEGPSRRMAEPEDYARFGESVARQEGARDGRLRERQEIAQRAAEAARRSGEELDLTMVESVLAALDELVDERVKAIQAQAHKAVKEAVDVEIAYTAVLVIVLVPLTLSYIGVRLGLPWPAAALGSLWCVALYRFWVWRSSIRRLAKTADWTRLEVVRKVIGED